MEKGGFRGGFFLFYYMEKVNLQLTNIKKKKKKLTR